MNLEPLDPPREFEPTPGGDRVRDCGRLRLEPGEQITLCTADGAEHDVVRTSWGFYATASLNDRLPRHGLQPVLVRNDGGRLYVLLVEHGHEAAFEAYRIAQNLTVVPWETRAP